MYRPSAIQSVDSLNQDEFKAIEGILDRHLTSYYLKLSMEIKLKPIYLCVIQEEVDGTVKKEFLHEMLDSRLHDLINRRSLDGTIYYPKNIRDSAICEVDRRQHNSLLTRFSDEIDFREDVIDAMCNSGMSRHVAKSMTSKEPDLMEQAKKFRVI